MDTVETRPQRTDLQVEPVRLQVLPLSEKGLDLDEEERQRIEVVLNSIRATGFARSVGGVWWTARAVGLVASLLSATPGMAPRGPAAGAGRDEEEQGEWDDARKDDQDKQDDEHRAAWIREARKAHS